MVRFRPCPSQKGYFSSGLISIKKYHSSVIVLFLFCAFSCSKDEPRLILDHHILAGHHDGMGVQYKQWQPALECTIADPWTQTDTTIHLDLDEDGVNDFALLGSVCHPSLLGGDCEELKIAPLFDNEVCIDPITQWLDTLPHLDTISVANSWTNSEALIHSYNWVLLGDSIFEGHWTDVHTAGSHYIGLKIRKNEKEHFGWLAMHRDTSASFSFLLSEYAILREYEE